LSQSITTLESPLVWGVWNKGHPVTISDAELWRKDDCGAWIKRVEYENLESQYGWVMGLIVPVSQGGRFSLENLRPLQWQNVKRDEAGNLVCSVTASSTENVRANDAALK